MAKSVKIFLDAGDGVIRSSLVDARRAILLAVAAALACAPLTPLHEREWFAVDTPHFEISSSLDRDAALPGVVRDGEHETAHTHSHATHEAGAEADATPESDAEADVTREADSMLDTGFVLRSHRGQTWGAHLMLPISIGWTEFDLGAGISLDDLATIAVVPTVEFIIPMNERWTLLPFAGAGFAWQTGDRDLIGDNDVIGLATGGVRVTRWQHFARRHWLGIAAEIRYDAALTGRDGLLGDWGSFDAAIELRRDFGAPTNEPRFQGGLYVQAFRFWDPVELDIAGVSPPSVKGQVEIGISLGSTSPYKLWRITLPRVFIGWLVGDGVGGVRIRSGRL